MAHLGEIFATFIRGIWHLRERVLVTFVRGLTFLRETLKVAEFRYASVNFVEYCIVDALVKVKMGTFPWNSYSNMLPQNFFFLSCLFPLLTGGLVLWTWQALPFSKWSTLNLIEVLPVTLSTLWTAYLVTQTFLFRICTVIFRPLSQIICYLIIEFNYLIISILQYFTLYNCMEQYLDSILTQLS